MNSVELWLIMHLNLLIPQLRVVIYEAFCLHVSQGLMNEVPNETQTHLWTFASLACKPYHHQRHFPTAVG